MTWIFSKLTIQGVKSVLDRAGDFTISRKGKPKSIAVFGRNAHGKSGYADAVEYLFSIDGEVEHLGKGSADSEQGGKHALPHVLASEKGITSQVSAEFTRTETGEKISVTRQVVTGRNDTRPAELEKILESAPAYRILRQHDLRKFVVDMTPGQKFVEFARWIGLNSATTVLKHLTTAESTLSDTSTDREINERFTSIELHTSGAVKAFDIQEILNWCSTEIQMHLKQPFTVSSVKEIDNGIAALRAKRETLVSQAKIARQNLQAAATEFVQPDGYIQAVKGTFESALLAEQRRNETQRNASESVFQEVWETSRSFLEMNLVNECPVCETPWDRTPTGTQEMAVVKLSKSLGNLAQLKEQDTALQQSIQTVKAHLQQLETRLIEISGHAKALNFSELVSKSDELHARSAFYQQTLVSADKNREGVNSLLQDCKELIERVIPESLDNVKLDEIADPSSEIDNTISHLQGVKESIDRLESLTNLQNSIRTVERAFNKVADKIRSETKKVADNAVNALRNDVQRIYKKIHPGEAVPNVFINLNTDEKTLTIRVNFHSNERVVPPGGYLSEAQINTLGLALFLSSVRLFNKDFPFVFLDDIVSSYDADSRARIVDVLAEDMNDFQIFLTTHDERFYLHLKGRLEHEDWLFERISGYDFENGPKRESDNLRTDQIDELIKQGNEKVAGNAVRQYMEEWFDTACERFWAYTPHRKGFKEYKRTLFDFWDPFLLRLKSSKGDFAKYVLSTDTYNRFHGGLMPIINYYSHNQTNPYEWPAMGDVVYIWDEFQQFTDIFNCASCKKMLQYDFSTKKFYCTCGGAIMPTET